MRSEKDQSGNPHGRPPGSRNKRTIAVEKLFNAERSQSAVALSCRFPVFRLFYQGRALLNPCMSPSVNRRRPLQIPCICLDQQGAEFLAMRLIGGPAWHPTIASS
jgi:hypothetical protein